MVGPAIDCDVSAFFCGFSSAVFYELVSILKDLPPHFILFEPAEGFDLKEENKNEKISFQILQHLFLNFLHYVGRYGPHVGDSLRRI